MQPNLLSIDSSLEGMHIKTHDSESRGQEEAALQPLSELFT